MQKMGAPLRFIEPMDYLPVEAIPDGSHGLRRSTRGRARVFVAKFIHSQGVGLAFALVQQHVSDGFDLRLINRVRRKRERFMYRPSASYTTE